MKNLVFEKSYLIFPNRKESSESEICSTLFLVLKGIKNYLCGYILGAFQYPINICYKKRKTINCINF
jgi:hypothetical protein